MAKILIDPGHGGTDAGTSSKGIYEKDLTLKGSLLLRDLLKTKGYEVYMTRDKDITLGVDVRGQMAKNLGVDLVFSFHFNAFNTAARGFECIHTYNNAAAKKVAQALADQMRAAGFAMRSQPVYTKESENYPGRSWFGVLRNAEPIPGVIAEALFIDNPQDVAVMNQPDFWNRLVKTYADGIGKTYDTGGGADATDYKKLYLELQQRNDQLAAQLIELANKLKE